MRVFDKYEKYLCIAAWLVLALMHSVTNSLTVIDDIARNQLAFAPWQAITWETSSQIALLILLWPLVAFDRFAKHKVKTAKQIIFAYFTASIIFSIVHVLLMVVLRKLIYLVMGQSYDFGHWPAELLYEYRKDLITFIQIIVIFHGYRFIISRLRNEASIINQGENTNSQFAERFIVKKIDQEFIVRAQDIEWVSAAGNYMNLHIEQRSYPLRMTMKALESKLDPQHFCRVHRSSLVNINHIKSIGEQESGDGQITLRNEQQVPLSRRYKEQLKAVLINEKTI